MIKKSIFCRKVAVHKDQKNPFISNLKKPTCASKGDVLELATSILTNKKVLFLKKLYHGQLFFLPTDGTLTSQLFSSQALVTTAIRMMASYFYPKRTPAQPRLLQTGFGISSEELRLDWQNLIQLWAILDPQSQVVVFIFITYQLDQLEHTPPLSPD